MSEVLFLRAEQDLGPCFLKFQDLKKRLEQGLNLVKTLTDLEALIGSLNDLMKSKNYSLEEKKYLKRIRQRAYERRHSFKMTTFDSIKPEKEPKPMRIDELPCPPVYKKSQQHVEAPMPSGRFWFGVQRGLSKVDGEKLVGILPGFLCLVLVSAAVVYMVWFQSVELYRSSGFSEPCLTAAGAILMVLGFAAYHAMSRSWIALFLCLYVGGYEAYFMISGTIQNENSIAKQNLENDPELAFLRDKAEKSKAAYATLKSRFDDPNSEVHNNDWFKKKHLEPTWDLNEKDQNVFIAKRKMLEQADDATHVTWLKVLYRLGLVFLCMVLVHLLTTRMLNTVHRCS